MLSARLRFDEFRISFFRPRNDMFVPSENQNWGADTWKSQHQPRSDAFFQPNRPWRGQLHQCPRLSAALRSYSPGRQQTNPQSESLRNDFSKIFGTHAFKMGYEFLHFTDNYYQQGYPSGQFNFANTTAGLQASGQPVPNTGNTFAGFELGSVSAVNFRHLYQHLAAAVVD